MKRVKSWVAGVGLCAAVAPAVALGVLLDFEGIKHDAQILGFYTNDGLGSSPPSFPPATNGTDFGVKFLSAPSLAPAQAAAYGNLSPIPELFTFSANDGIPTPGTSHPLLAAPNLSVMSSNNLSQPTAGSYAQMDSAGSFALSTLSFWYSSHQIGFLDSGPQGARVEALDSNQTSLGYFLLKPQFEAATQGQTCGDSVEATFCNWTKVSGADFTSTASGSVSSLRFYNDGNTNTETLYDNIQFQTTAAIPEPSTYALMALGLAGIAAISRRRRER